MTLMKEQVEDPLMEDTGIPESGSFGSEDLPKEAPPPQEAPPQQEEEEMGSDQFGLPDEKTSIGCGILGRYPIISLLGFVVTGIVLGIGLSFWRPTTAADMETKAVVLQWINLVGDMFLRMLKCIVLPIVFVNVVIAVVDMMQMGKAGGVGGTTVLIYISTTIIAGIFAVIFSILFKGVYLAQDDDNEHTPSYISLGCASSMDGNTQQANAFLMEYPNGTIACTDQYEADNDAILWTINDVNGTFVQSDGGGVPDLSLSDTIYSGVFETLIPENIFQEFYNANFAAVIVFAIALGVAAAKVLDRQQLTSSDMTFMALMVELDQILTVIINWIILLTPFAVLSLVAAAIGGETDLGALFKNMGLLIACILSCYVGHFLVTYCGGYYLMTRRRNPFTYMAHLGPAQILAFSCASSAATIPVSMECVESTHQVPEPILRFVIPLGATVNMDGACISIICSCVWLAVYNGIDVNAANYVLLVIISSFSSMGTAPVPNAALALIMTSYNTVFGGEGTPDGFSYLIAIDWFIDRCSTALNVTGDMTVCGVIGARIGMQKHVSTVRGSVRTKQQVHGSLYDLAASVRHAGGDLATNTASGFDSIKMRLAEKSAEFMARSSKDEEAAA